MAARGYEVRYYPAQALIDRFERVRFNREAGADDLTAMREILSCDLLILDDLGRNLPRRTANRCCTRSSMTG
ncbi:MAG: hypothetical protein ACLUNX_01430 [Angelakisella sp.]